MTPLDVVANEERYTAGAMVRAVAMVLDVPTELREHKDQHIVAGVVFFQIRLQIGNAAGHIGP